MSKKTLIEKLNQLNNSYYETKLELLKLNADISYFRRLNKIRKEHEEKLINEYGDDLDKLNTGEKLIIRV